MLYERGPLDLVDPRTVDGPLDLPLFAGLGAQLKADLETIRVALAGPAGVLQHTSQDGFEAASLVLLGEANRAYSEEIDSKPADPVEAGALAAALGTEAETEANAIPGGADGPDWPSTPEGGNEFDIDEGGAPPPPPLI